MSKEIIWLSVSPYLARDPVWGKMFMVAFFQTLNEISHSVMSDSATPWTIAWQASLSITKSQSLLKLMGQMCVLQYVLPIY